MANKFDRYYSAPAESTNQRMPEKRKPRTGMDETDYILMGAGFAPGPIGAAASVAQAARDGYGYFSGDRTDLTPLDLGIDVASIPLSFLGAGAVAKSGRLARLAEATAEGTQKNLEGLHRTYDEMAQLRKANMDIDKNAMLRAEQRLGIGGDGVDWSVLHYKLYKDYMDRMLAGGVKDYDLQLSMSKGDHMPDIKKLIASDVDPLHGIPTYVVDEYRQIALDNADAVIAKLKRNASYQRPTPSGYVQTEPTVYGSRYDYPDYPRSMILDDMNTRHGMGEADIDAKRVNHYTTASKMDIADKYKSAYKAGLKDADHIAKEKQSVDRLRYAGVLGAGLKAANAASDSSDR